MRVYLDERPLDTLVRDVLSLDGHLTPAVVQSEVLGTAGGASVLGSGTSLASQTITIGLDVWPDSLLDRPTAITTLTHAVSGVRVLRTEDDPTRERWVQCVGIDVQFYQLAISRCYVVLTMQAVDPVRYACEPVTVALSTARAAVTIGTKAVAPVLWLYGASPSVVDPVVIVRNAAGDETHRLTLTGTLATNDALMIDAATMTITRYVAGTVQTGTSAGNAWVASGEFPLLDPTDAIAGAGITVALSSTTGTATGLLLYRPTH